MTPTDEWPTRDHDTLVTSSPAGPPTPPPYPPEEPDSPLGRGMLLALLVIALAVVGALAGWLATRNNNNNNRTTTVLSTTRARTSSVAGAAVQQVAVPQLVGLTRQAAVIKLGQVGLKPKLEVRTTGPRDGLVAEQRPVPAQKISLGAPVVVLIDRLLALPAHAAKPKPKQATTTVTTTTTTVGATTPAAPTTTAQQNQSTTTTASSTTTPTTTPTQAAVPDVTGKPEAAAVDALTKAGLLVSIVFVPSSDDLGTVEAQSKSAGTTLPARSHVQLNLSGGNGKFPPESIPNVVGQTLHGAVAAMNGAQLRLIYEKQPVTSPASVGKIVQQTPLAGDKAPQHAQVLVYLGVLQH